jgi:hypothetical protein
MKRWLKHITGFFNAPLQVILALVTLICLLFDTAFPQSKLFRKELEILARDLKQERWVTLEQRQDTIDAAGIVQLEYRRYNPGTRYAFIALVDDCDSCLVEMFYLDEKGARKGINPTISRAKGITRAGYYFEVSDPFRAAFCVFAEADRQRIIFAIVAGY